MMTDRDGGNAVDGGLVRHIPVLAAEVLQYLGVRDGGVYIDGTFGAGGYTRAILDAADCRVIGIDRDPSAIAGGADLVASSAGRLTLAEDRFSNLDVVAQRAGQDTVDGVVLDVGVSSMQLDEAGRGFSFRHEGPLDMRMGGNGPSAADLIAVATERDLTAIIARLGEERFARPIARAIVRAREEAPILTTRQLSAIVERIVHARPGQIHPATRTFQALRIFVNEELAELAGALSAAERILKSGGNLVVISFHSLEDRIVKSFFADRTRMVAGSRHAPLAEGPQPTFTLLTRKPVVASDQEISDNPRARSAKLRAARRNDVPARDAEAADMVRGIPTLAEAMRGR
jgi:16S rRNA (cytosine1402-N4)-methyltransferase